MDEKEVAKILVEYVKHMPKKKATCYLKDCLFCTEAECENKAIIDDYLNELNQAYARINSPISAYIETEKLPMSTVEELKKALAKLEALKPKVICNSKMAEMLKADEYIARNCVIVEIAYLDIKDNECYIYTSSEKPFWRQG